jgi:GT2 family glycosyltransferase
MPHTYFIIGSFYGGERLNDLLHLLRKFNHHDYGILLNEQRGFAKTPIGIAVIFNQLVNAALYDKKCKFIWTIGDDAVPQGMALENTQTWMSENPEVGCAFPKEMTRGQPKFPHLKDNTVDWNVYPSLNCSIIRREAWEAIGGMDESLPYGQLQDLDWGVRCWYAGFQVVQYGYEWFEHEKESTYAQLAKEGLYDFNNVYKAAESIKNKWPFFWRDSHEAVMEMLWKEYFAKKNKLS